MHFFCTYCGNKIESAGGFSATAVTCRQCDGENLVPQRKEGSHSERSESPSSLETACNVSGRRARRFRRAFSILSIGCFTVGAVTAIFSILTSEIGAVQAKSFLTTVSLGFYSLTGLCCSVLADQPKFKYLGRLGIAISIAGAAFAVLTNWEIVTGWELLIKGRFSFLIVAIAFCHASLLLMIPTTDRLVRWSRTGTIVVNACITALLLVITLQPSAVFVMYLLLSVLGVVVTLGTIATLILHWATRDSRKGSPAKARQRLDSAPIVE